MEQGWHILDELNAGEMWAAVAVHPPVDELDRTHEARRTTLGLWLSPHRNPSRGRFAAAGEHRALGAVVAIPAGAALNVRSGSLPQRTMLHCRLPSRTRVPLPADGRLLSRCTDLRNGAIGEALARIAREISAPGFGGSSIVEGLGLVIAGELARELSGGDDARRRTGGLAPWQLRRIDEHLRAGHWNSSVSELATLCGLSAAHTMRAFRQSTGRPLAAHVARLRFARARDLLARDGLSIAQVASELRFAGPSGFAAAFRREAGMTPNAYRRRLAGRP